MAQTELAQKKDNETRQELTQHMEETGQEQKLTQHVEQTRQEQT